MMPFSFCIDTQTLASASTLQKERSDVEFPRIENVIMFFLSSVYR